MPYPLPNSLNHHGFALLYAVVFVMLVGLLGSVVVHLGYQQAKVTEIAVGDRVKDFYNTRAGLVDARERIAKNQMLGNWAGLAPTAADALGRTGFDNPLWPDAPGNVNYCLDVDTDTATPIADTGTEANCNQASDDVFIKIEKADGTSNGMRRITCVSIGN